MRKNNRGYTLVELMITVAVVVTLVAIGIAGCTALVSGDDVKQDAEKEARRYASEMKIKVDGLSCGDRPNAKGQVYCSVRSGANTISLSCIGLYKIGHGCRQVTAVAPGAEGQ